MYPSEKNTNHLTVRGGGGGVNPYGQPDRKISAFFFDDFPKLGEKFGDNFGDEFSESPYFVSNSVTSLVTNVVNHNIL